MKRSRGYMSSFDLSGKFLILAGIFVVILGLLVMFSSRIPLLDKLPGNIFFQKGDFRFFFPIVTCLVISAVLTIVINLIIRFLGK
jgi:hypothetical protein